MKKIALLFACLLLSASVAFGQSVGSNHNNRAKIGLTFSSFGDNNFMRKGYICDCAYVGDHYFDLGITYIQPINEWLSVETGIEYSKQIMKTTSNMPRISHSSTTSSFALLSIPLTARINFLNYLFVQGGFLVDIDMSSTSRHNLTGIGEMLGAGVEYEFGPGFTLFANPYIKFHSNIHFSKSHTKLTETGFRFGIAFTL